MSVFQDFKFLFQCLVKQDELQPSTNNIWWRSINEIVSLYSIFFMSMQEVQSCVFLKCRDVAWFWATNLRLIVVWVAPLSRWDDEGDRWTTCCSVLSQIVNHPKEYQKIHWNDLVLSGSVALRLTSPFAELSSNLGRFPSRGFCTAGHFGMLQIESWKLLWRARKLGITSEIP